MMGIVPIFVEHKISYLNVAETLQTEDNKAQFSKILSSTCIFYHSNDMVSHPVKHNQSSRDHIRVVFPHRPFHAATQSADSTSYRTFKYQPLHLHHPMSHLELKQIPNIAFCLWSSHLQLCISSIKLLDWPF